MSSYRDALQEIKARIVEINLDKFERCDVLKYNLSSLPFQVYKAENGETGRGPPVRCQGFARVTGV